jgi:hypothetical protein
MSIFLQATLEIDGAGYQRFVQTMAEWVPIIESSGWKLNAAYMQRTGRLNTVIDVWEVEDMAHIDRGFQQLMGHPRFGEFKKVLDETVKSETLIVLQKFSYAS